MDLAMKRAAMERAVRRKAVRRKGSEVKSVRVTVSWKALAV